MAGPSTPKPTRKPYRVYLSAALHRRFIRATFFALLICYVEAVIIGFRKSWFWLWFPLGKTGIRTLLLFLSSLSIFVLRVAQIHIGPRNTVSPFDSLKQYALSLRVLQTLSWYFLSALLFCEVVMWSSPKSADLAWVIPGKAYERARLNERPIFLRSVFFILATFQSLWHLYYDNDRVPLQITNRKPETPTGQGTHVVVSPFEQIRTKAIQVLKASVYRTVPFAVAGPVIYWALLRKYAWKFTVFFAKLFWDLPRSQSHPSGLPPYHVYLIIRSVLSSFLLMFLWESSNVLFTAFASEEPLKLGKPLTNVSKDPDWSLLTGLKSKKELPRTFAFWELMLISERFPERRKAIFEGLDREGGSTWKQILVASLNVIGGMEARIKTFQKSRTPPDPNKPIKLETLPKLAEPLQEDNVFAKQKPRSKREWVQKNANNVALLYGSEPDWTPQARKVLGHGADYVGVTPEIRQKVTPRNLAALFWNTITQFLRSPLGVPFRQTFRRRTTTVIFGTSYSEVTTIIDAIDSVTCLLICSLKEDTFGKVQEDVPLVVKTFTSNAQAIRKFVAETEPHWSDVYPDRKVHETVGLALACLEDRLGDLLGAFSLYLEDVGVRGEELIAARKAATGGEALEMIEARK